MSHTKKQVLKNKIGEVKFRKLLTQQHRGHGIYFQGQPDKESMAAELKKRNQATREDFQKLLVSKVRISPFLEIGAEKCQRSMLLVNEFKMKGVAADLSYESLQSAEYFKKNLNYKSLPQRICLDAYHLPFADNSFAFVFFYETLHHFPDPKPILEEAFRVVKNHGHVFFGEEPVKQLVNARLWRRDFHLSPLEKLLKYSLMLPFLSTIGKSEVEHGILEETFWLDIWEKSLAKFKFATATLKPYAIGKTVTIHKENQQAWLQPNFLAQLLLALQGGGIQVLARVDKPTILNGGKNNVRTLFICPNCPSTYTLHKKGQVYVCNRCKDAYPIKNGIPIFIPKQLRQKLYPSL